MSFFSRLFKSSNTFSGGEKHIVNTGNQNGSPVMLILADYTDHMIKGEYCRITKVGIKKDIAYIYNEFRGVWYKVDLLDNLVEEVDIKENMEDWECKTLKKGTILWQLANTVCICGMMWSGSSPFQIDDVFTSITSQINNNISRYNAVAYISRNSWTTKCSNKQISMEKLIRMIPISDVSNGKGNKTLHIDDRWTLVKGVMQQSHLSNLNPIVPEGTANFRGTIYVCPTCGKFITKVLLKETYINVDGTKQEIDKTFSCKYCDSFYAPVIGHNLNEGAFYYLKVSPNRYKNLVQTMDQCSR
ncbi:hypothetical protein KQI30_09600 [Clostridium bornimense]|uniref:hypothetical protein n=1 Tax=Clostridium bornimense TaxID=1216932 RepID=UPI001C0F4406|nr:hypothetical protein [Clostridium bornimense]MBU5316523.1 hypothetical protein [Clostridium bornimense]